MELGLRDPPGGARGGYYGQGRVSQNTKHTFLKASGPRRQARPARSRVGVVGDSRRVEGWLRREHAGRRRRVRKGKLEPLLGFVSNSSGDSSHGSTLFMTGKIALDPRGACRAGHGDLWVLVEGGE